MPAMPAAALETVPRLRRLLHGSILPWWRPVCAEPDGGFRLGHDIDGRLQPVARVHLVPQARLVWTACRLHRHGIEPDFWGSAARRGLDFLLRRLGDSRHGGFAWSVTVDGTARVESGKHLYGQAFALLALVEAAEALDDPRAGRAARALWTTIEQHAHDPAHGGYRECFDRDWTPPPPAMRSPMGGPADAKLANTHLHLMDAVRAYAGWSGDDAAARRLCELVLICAVAIQRRDPAFPTDGHRRDWHPLPEPAEPASHGHAIELAWLLPRAARAAGIAPDLVRGLCDDMARAVLRFGFDHREGGVFRAGPLGAEATRRDKDWWAQAEALAGFLDRCRDGGGSDFAAAYGRTLDWIETRQVDEANGEWHRSIGPDGTVTGRKADIWKCPYHQVRALLHCLDILAGDGAAP